MQQRQFQNFLLFIIANLMMLVGMITSANAEVDFLPPDRAFRFEARAVSNNSIEVVYKPAVGYYLYKEKFSFTTSNPAVKLGVAQYPKPHKKYDENFQKEVETYHDVGTIKIPVTARGNGKFQVIVHSQGCAEKGLCYPPQETPFQIDLTSFASTANASKNSTSKLEAAQKKTEEFAVDTATKASTSSNVIKAPTVSEKENGLGALWGARHDATQLGALLQSLPLALLLFGFVLLGISLSLTPCVLPMVPILSSIITGEIENEKRPHPFILALIYVLGMATVYTLAGVVMAQLGSSAAAFLQSPWLLAIFSVLLVLMALSMFDVYSLELPKTLQAKLNHASQKHEGGRYLGVAMMGAISALMVGPCVTAPLAGVLGVIAQTGSSLLGGSLLFALAMGMGAPLLLVGAGLGHWLPKTGAWMLRVKHFFGIMLIALAIWLIRPFISESISYLLWIALALGVSIWLGLFNLFKRSQSTWEWVEKVMSLCALAIAIGMAWTWLAPTSKDTPASIVQAELHWQTIRNEAELNAVLSQLKQPAMLDFYADWCVSCKEMERFTLNDATVKNQLQNVKLLRVDVTQNNADDKALLKRFQLYGPPGMIFFDTKGAETKRVIGYQDTPTFLRSIKQALE